MEDSNLMEGTCNNLESDPFFSNNEEVLEGGEEDVDNDVDEEEL